MAKPFGYIFYENSKTHPEQLEKNTLSFGAKFISLYLPINQYIIDKNHKLWKIFPQRKENWIIIWKKSEEKNNW